VPSPLADTRHERKFRCAIPPGERGGRRRDEAQAGVITPSQFNSNLSSTAGVVPTDNFASLWAWDTAAANWYFYSPLLEAAGGLAAVKAYTDSHGMRHFEDYGKTIGLGVGFWVNRP